ncbi:MAG: isoprenyl transferase [Pseudomonadota bacterium]
MSDAPLLAVTDSSRVENALPRHVAIIMDGNGRWANERGLPRVEGHRMGVEAVRKVTRAAGELGLDYLTLYSFSSENWNRPQSEITELFGLLRLFIRKHLAELHQNNVRVVVIGGEDGVPDDILKLINDAVKLTENNDGLGLVIAFNYGARGEITNAVKRLAAQIASGEISADDVTPDLVGRNLQTADIPDPDLIIRTSGEQRLSNFLLWQAAYSELIFTPCYWPDFDQKAFMLAIDEYCSRDRRFGAISARSG